MTVGAAMFGLVGLLPVLSFLAALLYLDSYKLVKLRAVIAVVAAGAAVAGASYFVNAGLLSASGLEFRDFTRYVAPVTEEFLKGLVIVALVRAHRVGFLVDAAIFGFAVGAGFALVENLFYLHQAPEAGLGVWIVRGFGTAIMHGGATAVLAIVAVSQAERFPDKWLRVFLPGLVAAVILHGVYNTLLVRPVFATLGVLMLLPPLIYFAFENSEKALRDWLESDLDSDVQLIETINAGEFLDSHAGRYVHSLQDRFDGPVLADMLCYLRLHCELALRAKGVLMLRESGFDEPPLDDEVKAQIEELRYLERSIGKSGQLALRPILMATGKDLWQLQLLQH